MAAPRTRLVRQYGPAIGTQGGMASALESYSRLPLRRFRLEFVPTWTPDAFAWGAAPFARALAGLGRSSARDTVAHIHLSVRGSFVREGILTAVAAARGCPVVLSLHGGEMGPFIERHPRLAQAVFRRADVVLALGEVTREVVRPFLRPGARVVIVPNPVDLPATTTPAGQRDEVVLFAGEVRWLKGVDTLIEAWPRVLAARPHARLVVAGRPGDVEPAPLDRARWCGPLSRAQVAALLEDARVAVLPSRAEVMPMFVLEAMAAARPVVATPVGEVRTMLDGHGTLVPEGDAEALAAALVRLLAEPAAASAQGQALRRRAEERFAPQPVARRLEEVYDALAPPGR